MSNAFDYEQAVSRNIGWVSEWEQALLRSKRVAIAGLGGVGGQHLVTLARLGIGTFHIADFDRFELANFNRQAGAMMSTIGRRKIDVMTEMALDIQPSARIRAFEEGVTPENVDAFLDGVDLFVDALDAYALETRRMVYARCAVLGIPAVAAGPLGMGTAYFAILPGGPTFEEFFRFSDRSAEDNLGEFFAVLFSASRTLSYLVDRRSVDISSHRGPSTPMACQLCAGVVGAETLKILLGRGTRRGAPYVHCFDAYRGEWISRKVTAHSPAHAIRRHMIRGRIRADKQAGAGAAREPEARWLPTSDLERILDQGRWAPSGDNQQRWRFEIVNSREVRVHLSLPDGDVYDLDGTGAILSAGFLLETLRAAATELGYLMNYESIVSREKSQRVITVRFDKTELVSPDPRAGFIRVRSVDRRPYRAGPLRAEHKACLERVATSEGLRIRFFESTEERLQIARLNALATDIRLRIPESREKHVKLLEFDVEESRAAIPAKAIGLDPLTCQLMKWALATPERNEWMLRLGGTLIPRVELDLIPGLACSAHFLVAFDEATPSELARLHAGEVMQRLWLEATRLGLAMQPGYAPIIFSRYARRHMPFTKSERIRSQATRLATQLDVLWPDAGEIIFAARIGTPWSRAPKARSVRKPLSDLLAMVDADSRLSRSGACCHREIQDLADRTVR